VAKGVLWEHTEQLATKEQRSGRPKYHVGSNKKRINSMQFVFLVYCTVYNIYTTRQGAGSSGDENITPVGALISYQPLSNGSITTPHVQREHHRSRWI
jgi:hypothetical protein